MVCYISQFEKCLICTGFHYNQPLEPPTYWNATMGTVDKLITGNARMFDLKNQYERHFGYFYHNPTLLVTVSITSKWVNTDLIDIFIIEIQRHGIIIAPIRLCYCLNVTIKCKKKFRIIYHDGLSQWIQTTWYSCLVIAQSLTMSAHSRQSERQNIIDRTHDWRQSSVIISEDILTTTNIVPIF